MPRVRFLKLYNWDVPETNRRQTIQYLPGMRELVTTPCAKEAVAAGAAEYIASLSRDAPAISAPPDEAPAPVVEASKPTVRAAQGSSGGRGK